MAKAKHVFKTFAEMGIHMGRSAPIPHIARKPRCMATLFVYDNFIKDDEPHYAVMRRESTDRLAHMLSQRPITTPRYRRAKVPNECILFMHNAQKMAQVVRLPAEQAALLL